LGIKTPENWWASLPGVSKIKVSFEDKDTHKDFNPLNITIHWRIENETY